MTHATLRTLDYATIFDILSVATEPIQGDFLELLLAGDLPSAVVAMNRLRAAVASTDATVDDMAAAADKTIVVGMDDEVRRLRRGVGIALRHKDSEDTNAREAIHSLDIVLWYWAETARLAARYCREFRGDVGPELAGTLEAVAIAGEIASSATADIDIIKETKGDHWPACKLYGRIKAIATSEIARMKIAAEFAANALRKAK